MKAIAAYVLLVLGGNATPSVEDITNLITSVGGTALLGDLEGKDIHELLAEGEKKLKSVVGVASAAPGAGGAGKLVFFHNITLPLFFFLPFF